MFQYITLAINTDSLDQLNDILNDIGKEGWSLCTGNPHPLGNGNFIMAYIFKKPILERSDWLARREQQRSLQNSLQRKIDARTSRTDNKHPDPNNFRNQSNQQSNTVPQSV